ncbi:MAG: MBL fold metallo-hydrolase [Balneolaceae bacterium]|nr:MBL fold metallo-hydrolase [Balneolaceae bacterium]MCH8548286.1 MBL fold metallo-hydrolase [Balneolaceae bacterium]
MNSFSTGNLELIPIEAGRFLLDGGAMFGVVPKTLWSRQIPADEKNRITMAMRCLLVKSKASGKTYLIDNGSGDKFNEKMAKIYGLDYEHSSLLNSLKKAGVKPEEITDMVFSHLHFDHCGGTTRYNENGNLEEVFPNATYHVNKRHWETANNPNAREKASFFDENINPIKESGRLNLVDDFHSFEEGFDTLPMDGHTVGQQLPVFSGNGHTIVYAADLLPTFAHVPLPWVMGYDMAPVQTLTEKEEFLKKAARENWFIFLEHDSDHEVITIKEENGKFSTGDSLKLAEIS